MLLGYFAISLNLLSIAVLAFAISLFFIVLIERHVITRIESASFKIRKVTLWLLVTSPWWVAFTCLGIFWPQPQGIFPFEWLNDFAHWHHVDHFNFTSWHTLTLLLTGTYLTWALAKTIFVSSKQCSALGDLLGFSGERPAENSDNGCYYTIPNTVPTAFTFGMFRPKVYLTTALKQQVSNRDLAIVVSHEVAHVKARDPLFKFIFAIFANVFPSTAAKNLRNQYTLLTEQMADNAVTKVHDKLDVAQALVRIARLQHQHHSAHSSLNFAMSPASYFGEDQISKRVNYLIAPVSIHSRWAIAMTLLMLGVFPWVTASGVDSLHHLIETIFTH